MVVEVAELEELDRLVDNPLMVAVCLLLPVRVEMRVLDKVLPAKTVWMDCQRNMVVEVVRERAVIQQLLSRVVAQFMVAAVVGGLVLFAVIIRNVPVVKAAAIHMLPVAAVPVGQLEVGLEQPEQTVSWGKVAQVAVAAVRMLREPEVLVVLVVLLVAEGAEVAEEPQPEVLVVPVEMVLSW